MKPSILLASSSPRRKQLLEQIGYTVLQVPANIDETIAANEPAALYVQRLALEKARTVAQHHAQSVIVAADTAISINNHIIGKPDNFAHACDIWRQLAQQWHHVLSAITLYYQGHYYSALSTNQVFFTTMSDAEMLRYWQSGEPQDKAGAYAIQGLAAQWIKEIQGSYSAIMGLPLFELSQLFQQAGMNHE